MLLLTFLFGGAAALACVLAIVGYVWLWPVVLVFAVLWIAGLAFFRDPERVPPSDSDVMVSPADGRVTEISHLAMHEDIGGPALKIGIFLSVLDVHINRSPCDGVVRDVRYQPGKFLDARHPECGRLNEANTIVLDTNEGPVIVRQVAGLIARRIVCTLKVGDRVRLGERIGLIKFGSRTELIVPDDRFEPTVKVGDFVAGACTIVMRRSTGKQPRVEREQVLTHDQAI
jgi:phosphatidylserine decarboxylase